MGLFSDMRRHIEEVWLDQLLDKTGIKDDELPVIWDADFFINDPFTNNVKSKYSLCEINVSSVSPFPPAAIPFIVERVTAIA